MARNKTNLYFIPGTINWAQVKNPDENGKYYVDFIPSDLSFIEEMKAEAAAMGYKKIPVNVRDEDGLHHIHPKTTFKPRIYARDGQQYEEEDVPRIGIGSTGIVAVKMYEYKFKGVKGVALNLVGLQLDNLVEYTPKPLFGDLDDVELPEATDEDLPFGKQ